MLTYQDQRRIEAELAPPEPHSFATVVSVAPAGLTLIFDGETVATNKLYKYNKSITFAVNDRVKVIKISGTYIVEYPIN